MKWAFAITPEDIYVFPVAVRETALRYYLEDQAWIRDGFRGTKASLRELLGYHSYFEKTDDRLLDTEEEARNALIVALVSRRNRAERQLAQCNDLIALYNNQ